MNEPTEFEVPPNGDTSGAADAPSAATRRVLIVLVVVALVLFIAWARREPGFDDRRPDAEDAVGVFVTTTDPGGVG